MECSCNEREFYPAKASFDANGFTHIITFRAGYVCEKMIADPSDMSNHGVSSLDMLFIVKNDRAAVQFVLMTGWYPPYDGREEKSFPIPADLGYHSPTPRYEGQEPITGKACPWTGGVCYYDGSGLNAQEPFDVLVSQGESALWKFLEDYHKHLFS